MHFRTQVYLKIAPLEKCISKLRSIKNMHNKKRFSLMGMNKKFFLQNMLKYKEIFYKKKKIKIFYKKVKNFLK